MVRLCFAFHMALIFGAVLPHAAVANTLPTGSIQKVDVELVIAVDVSGSMSDHEHQIQRDGFVAAFRNPELMRAIRGGIRGRIAVTYVEWANHDSQNVLVPWRIIDGAAAGEAFATELAPLPRSPIRGTSISGALQFSGKLFDGNGIESFRRVVDVSGDGPNRTGAFVDKARDELVAAGIVINGLPIMLGPMISWRTHGYGLDAYFEDCVIGGPGAFVYPVTKESELTEAIRRKLILEVSGRVPTLRQAQFSIDGRQPGAATPNRPEGQKTDCRVGRSYRYDW